MALKKVARSEIIAPKLVRIKKPEVVLADCCDTSDPYIYIRYNREWKQVVWLPAPTEGDPNNVAVGAWAAKCCHHCGTKLSSRTILRAYHPGTNEPLDAMVKALGGP